MSNAVLEHIRQVLGNLLRACNNTQTYVKRDYPWLVILAAAAFVIFSTINSMKGCILCSLIFGRDIVLLIKHTVD